MKSPLNGEDHMTNKRYCLLIRIYHSKQDDKDRTRAQKGKNHK